MHQTNFDKTEEKWETKFDPDDYKRPIKLRDDLINSKDNKKILKKGSKINFQNPPKAENF